MTDMGNKTYIIVLNYNGWQDTVECLESVIKSDYPNYQIVVVDNDSDDGSLEHIRDWANSRLNIEANYDSDSDDGRQFSKNHGVDYWTSWKAEINESRSEKAVSVPALTLIKAAKNGGFAYGNNIGITFALSQDDFKYIWLLNNDTVIYPDTLTKLTNCFEQKSKLDKIGILGNIQRFYYNPQRIQAIAGGFDKWKARVWNVGVGRSFCDAEVEVPDFHYIYGASMVLSKKCIEEVGLLNEEYFMYFEEIDYAERAEQKGFQLAVCDKVSILHKYRATVSMQGDQFKEYYLRKNMINFYKLYYPQLVFIPLLKLFLIMLKDFFLGGRFVRVYARVLRDLGREKFAGIITKNIE